MKMDLHWPQAAVIAAALLAVGLVLAFAPETTQTQVIEWLGWGLAAASSLLGPLVRRRVAAAERRDDLRDDGDDSSDGDDS